MMWQRSLAAALALGMCLTIAATARAQGNPGEPKVGDKAKDFELKTITGENWKLSTQTAKGPVVVVVLRGWPGYQCPACSKQFNDLLKDGPALAEKKAQVVFVYPGPADGLNEKAKDFIGTRKLPSHYTLVTDPDYKMITAWGLRWAQTQETSYPSTFVLDKEGKIQFAKISHAHDGRAEAAEVVKALK